MKVSFLVAVLSEIITVISETEAYPKWKWKPKINHKSLSDHRRQRGDGCITGQCVQSWECPNHATSTEPTGSCAYWTHGPWVCCTLEDDGHYNTPKEFHGQTTKSTSSVDGVPSKWYPKRTTTRSWRQNSISTSTEGNWKGSKEDWATTPCLTDPWNRNSRDRPTPISSLADIPINSWNRQNSSGSWSKPSKAPNLDVWKKTTSDIWNKRTTSNPQNSRTSSNSHNIRTTSSPQNSRTSSNSHNIRTTSRPQNSRTSSNSHNIRTTSSPQNSRTTKYKPSTSDSRIIFPTKSPLWTWETTKHVTPTSLFWKKTTKISDWKTTAKPWVAPTRLASTTRSAWGATPGYPERVTTRSSGTRRTTLSTKIPNNVGSSSGERINQGRGTSTPGYPVRGSSTRFSNTYTTSTRASSTTRRHRVTTPLPDVNTYLCGIRDERPQSRRQGRKYNSDYVVVHKDSKNTRGRDPYQRIVGGEESEPFSWPWVAALYKMASSGVNRFLSAGSLINENFVLTAAHPFTRDDLRSFTYVVMLGTHNAEDAVAEYMVSSVLQHPSYEQRFYYHDIALLRLVRPVIFNDFVMPVCLPSPNAPLLKDSDLEGKNVTVMGWGDESFGGRNSRVLKEASFPIMSRRSCNASYVRVASNRFPRGITENMLCAGDPNGGKDACQGDSGGPLTSVERGRYTQVGIVSFGYQCGNKEFPGVYTKVAPYLSWIAENTERVRDTDYSNYDYEK